MKSAAAPRPGFVRIIAGRLRGRRIPILDHAGLRPSPDRVRETLFNWLAPELPGARVLDLFAGTGVLGLEALSRGALHLVAVEREPRLATALRQVAEGFAVAASVEVLNTDALGYLRVPPALPFDLVFIDPPYADGLWPEMAQALCGPGWLRPRSLIYCECPAACPEPLWPTAWSVWKASRAGQVRYQVLRHQADPASPGASQWR